MGQEHLQSILVIIAQVTFGTMIKFEGGIDGHRDGDVRDKHGSSPSLSLSLSNLHCVHGDGLFDGQNRFCTQCVHQIARFH